jgi:hypothetical protein
MPTPRLLVHELNEAPRGVLEEYAAAHPRGGLARLLGRGQVWDTVTRDAGHLSPWTTWATVHRGVGAGEHGVRDLGQDLGQVNARHPCLWRLALERGRAVGVGGSLGSAPLPADAERFAFYLPDCFAQEANAHPPALAALQELTLAMVDRSGRNAGGGAGLPWGLGLRAALRAGALGWGPGTFATVARQLASERLRPVRRARRRNLLPVLGFAAFRRAVRRTRPELATFFTNHLAASLHRYWPARWPEDYQRLRLPQEWHARYGGEVDAALRLADQQVAALLRLAEEQPGTLVALVSSMGQAALDDDQVRECQLALADLPLFMEALGLPAEAWSRRRAMEPRTVVQVGQAWRAAFREALGSLHIQGEPVAWAEHDQGVFMVQLGQRNLRADQIRVERAGVPTPHESLGLTSLEIEDRTGAYAYHRPEGVLAVLDPSRPGETQGTWSAGEEPVDTRALAPAFLEALGVEPPKHMQVRGLRLGPV